MRFLRAFLLPCLFFAVATFATNTNAWFPHGELPFATQYPQIAIGSGFTGPTPQPATQGVSTQFGYNDNAIAIWDSVPYALYNAPTPICVLAFHNSGIASVMFSLDGGAWTQGVYTTTGPANTPPQPSTTGITPTGEYCARLTPAALLDGQHELRAIATPNVGIPRVLQSGAQVTVTAGNPIISHAAHGQFWGKTVLVSGGLGFAAATPYTILAGGMTPGSYMLAASSTLVPLSAPFFSGGTGWLIYQTNSYTAGQQIVLSFAGGNRGWPPTGLSFGVPYYVCANNLSSVSFQLSDTLADANGACSDLSPSGSFYGTTPTVSLDGSYYATPVVVPTGSGTLVVDYLNKSGLEKQVSMGESLFIFTNTGGHAQTGVQYVDATPGGAGVDPGTPSRTSCTTPAAPCATIHGAMANLASGGGSITNVSAAGDGCALFTKAAHGLPAGQAVLFTGGLGGNFTTIPGSISPISNFSPTTPTGQVYWVTSDDYTSGAFTVASSPQGSCIPWAAGDSYGTGGTFHNVLVYSDIGGSTVYLMCDAPCATPTPYAYGAASESTVRNSVQTYLNILPAPGLAASNVAITSLGSSSGVRANKVHLAANITAPVMTLTTVLDSPAGSATFSFAANSLPDLLNINSWEPSQLTGGAQCASTGFVRSGLMNETPVTAFTQSDGGSPPYATITVSVANFADCPAGTVLTFSNSFALESGFDIWLDGATATGPGIDVYNSQPVGETTAWTGGIFYTNVVTTQNDLGLSGATFTRSSVAHDLGSVSNNSTFGLINSTAFNMGLDGARYVTTISPTIGSSNKIYVAAGTLPANIATGWLLASSGGSNPCGTGLAIVGYSQGSGSSPGWIQFSSNTPSTCGPGLQLYIGTGFHSDWAFIAEGGNNDVVASSGCLSGCNVEGYFEQQQPFFDQALVNSVINIPYAFFPPAGFFAIDLQEPLTNGYFANNVINGLVNFYTGINFIGTDVVFSNNTCPATYPPYFVGAVTNAASGITGITIVGGNC